MNVRRLPNKYLPEGGLISIPRFALAVLPLTAAASLRAVSFLLGAADPFPNTETLEDLLKICKSFAQELSPCPSTHAVGALTVHTPQFPQPCCKLQPIAVVIVEP